MGAVQLTLRKVVGAGGKTTLVLLCFLNFIDDLPRAVRVLAPDIGNSLNVSDAVLAGVLGVGGVALAVGALPLAALADRYSRRKIIALASSFWAAAMVVAAFVVNIFQLFWTSTVIGFGQAYRIPLAGSLISDTYPVEGRARVFAVEALGRPLGLLCGPVIVGLIAAIAGGDEGWRWAILFLAFPPLLVAVVAFSSTHVEEPARGQFEQAAGVEVTELEVSMRIAFARLRQIPTFRFLAAGLSVLGFALLSVPLQFNLLLEDKYALGALARGVVESLIWLPSLLAIPIAGRKIEKVVEASPHLLGRFMGVLLAAAGCLYLLAFPIKTIGLLVLLTGFAQALISAAFVAAPVIIALVAPYRIRAQAFAVIPVSVFLFGGFVGGVIAGQLSEVYNNRTALILLAPGLALLGGWLLWRGASHIGDDASAAIVELREEQTEVHKAVSGEGVPLLQLRNLDVCYGSVQVLFDVELELAKGEVVALLGANGAGKTTLLRTISGLGVPQGGSIKLNGRTITYTEAETRFRLGIVQVRGGEGIFPGLSVKDNLRAAVLKSDMETEEYERKTAEFIETFPVLGKRFNDLADDLSGGQQQMLALAMALIHDPEILLIDELSLGLAPAVVAELLAVIADLKAGGQTMLIVEQSLNVALEFADRAVFLEKGLIRYSGSAKNLAEHTDLARTVFFGGSNS